MLHSTGDMRILLTCLFLSAGLLLGVLPIREARAQLEAPTPERRFAETYELFANRLYREAIHGFSEFRHDFPNHVNAADALYYQAEASLAVGLEDEAVALFRKLEQLYPVHPLSAKSRLALGKHFYSTGEYGRAIQVFEEVLEDEPSPDVAARALYWMGESALNRGRVDEALRYFRRAADDYRETDTAPVALYTIGYTQVKEQNYDAAAEAFELLGARYPESSYSQNVGLALAEVYYELDDYQRAVDEIRRRLPNLDPAARERATFLLAESYNQLRDHENAIVEYRKFTQSSPYYRRAVYGLAWNYYFQGSYQWAVEQFHIARDGHDDNLAARATYYEAVNQKLAKEPEAAIGLLEEFLDEWPRHDLAPAAQFELALGYYEQRRWDDAHEAFSDLVERYEDSQFVGQALYYRGNAAVAKGNFEDALRNFEQAIDLEAAPASLKDEVRFQRAWLQYRSGKYREAVQSFAELHREAPRSDQGSESLFWSAESYYQLGELGRAAELFTKYLRDYPGGKHVDAAHYALGWTNFRQGNYGRAAEEFRRFLDEFRVSGESEFVGYRTDATLRLGDSYFALKRYSDAIRTYRQVVEEAGDYALYQIAQAHYNAGNVDQAIATLRELLTQYGDGTWVEEARYNLGYMHFSRENYDEAIAEYRRLIETHPRDPLAARAQYGIGDALFNAGRSEEAIEAYTVVLERYADSPYVSDAAAGIQYALAAVGDDARADAIIEEFAREHPNSPIIDELRFRQAEVKYQSGQTDRALADLQQFVRSSRNEKLLPEAYYYLGSIFSDRGRYEEAIGYLRQVVERYPSSARYPDAARRLGTIYLDEERPQDALSVYRRLESAAGGDNRLIAEARYGQGMALLQTGRTEEAERLLRNAVEAAPDAPETLPASLGLARVYEGSGRTSEAIPMYSRVVENSRDEIGAEALYRLGSLLLEMGDARRAIEELSRMPVLFTGYTDWVARGYLAQAQAFRALGQNGDAVRIYDRVISEFGGTPYAATAEQEKEAL